MSRNGAVHAAESEPVTRIAAAGASNRDAADAREALTITASVADESARSDIEPASLTIVHCPDESVVGRVVALPRSVLVIGREVDIGLRVSDAAMSRTHLRIVFDVRHGTYQLGDAGSRNGTRLDGKTVVSERLESGAVIRAGETLMVFGHGDEMSAVNRKAEAAASSDLSVLILGETGVGKELLARRIHKHSGRKGPFVAVNCASLVRDLAAGELFGHRRGAFSGATEPRDGLFLHADGGTLLLDEVADCPLELQVALLRALQERQIRPIGSDREISVDVRVLAATLFDLPEQIAAGRFRADLYARLAETVIRVPALRQRRSEVLSLAAQFAEELNKPLSITTNAAEALLLWSFPHNIRELRSLIRSFVHVTGARSALDLVFLRAERPEMCALFEPGTDAAGASSVSVGARGEREELERLLVLHAGNVSSIAQALGKPRSHVYRHLRACGLSASRFRGEKA